MKRWMILACFLSVLASAKPPKGEAEATKTKESTHKSIDFDGDVIEGMNRQPLDSVTQLSEGDGLGKRNHMYRRTKKFNDEHRELAREIVETY